MTRILLIVLAFLAINSSYSQDLERNYHFDLVTISNVKDYSHGFMGKVIDFINQKDSTYNLFIKVNGLNNEATLNDRKKKQIIKFDVDEDFDYKTIDDLNKLSNSKLFTVVVHSKHKSYKNSTEDFEYELDSINNKTIVHLTRFKNKKRKKIISEHYHFLSVNNIYDGTSSSNYKNYILENHSLRIADNQELEKILHLKDGKIWLETQYISKKIVDFNFKFKIDEVYPKR
ncbi:hypothetical protein GCM10022271_16500 [Corallibacter vietnamensis]|uniref:DUF3108 domain-containing protein n=1 Tax=Corallibacter vietnamensis TaxID=904130 RepID=A0ABP7H7Q6_9FLAO